MLDSTDIQDLLPHRYPFLLIDKVIELEPEKRIVAKKNVTLNEPFFQGHFPGNPIMPGVLIVEAMAQAGAILAFRSGLTGENVVYFMSIEKAKFRKPVVPGDSLTMEVTVLQRRNNVWKFSGKTSVDGSVVSEADFTAMVQGKDS